MIDRPIFKPSYQVEIVPDDGAYLLSDAGDVALRGKLYARLAGLMSGGISADEIVDALATEATPAEIYYLLGVLEDRGYIVEGAGPVDAARAALWDGLGLDTRDAEARLRTTTVALTAVGTADLDGLSRALTALGVRIGTPGDLAVVIADDYLDPHLETVNRSALSSGQPWLLIKTTGTQTWVGPLFRPGTTACFACLSHRLHGNFTVRSHVRRSPARTSDTRRPCPSSVSITALHFAAVETAKTIACPAAGDTSTQILRFDLVGALIDRHTVARRPQCPCCGDARRGFAAPVLQPRPKQIFLEGRQGTASAEQTIDVYSRHVSPISGVVKSLVRLDAGISKRLHVYVAGHNFALGRERTARSRHGLRSQSSGKGLTDAQARASALCEALERYCGVHQGDEPLRRASWREIAGDAVHPAAYLHFSARQYAQRADWNGRGSHFNRIPEPFDEADCVDWTTAWSVSEDRPKYLLTAYCYYGFPGAGAQYCWADSNGCAAGATFEEAVVQGFMELVERDAVALWWYNRARRPCVDLDAFDQSYLQAVRSDYCAAGRDLWVLDLTSDLGIPVFASVSRRRDQAQEQILFGFGAHFDPVAGVQRAIAEMNQGLARALSADIGRARGQKFGDADFSKWWRTATVAEYPYLAPDPTHPAVRYPGLRPRSSTDFREDVLHCREIVERHGMEMLVVDHTRPDIALPVVKVVVPGLRHFWARFAPGRLFDVPPRLLWIDRPLAETELNPMPMFL